MSRTEVKVDIKMRPPVTPNTPARPYIHRSNRGNIIIYEDQLCKMNNIVAKCRTLKEAEIAINDFRRGLDLHHSNVSHLTMKSKPQSNKPARKVHTPVQYIEVQQKIPPNSIPAHSKVEEAEQMRISA